MKNTDKESTEVIYPIERFDSNGNKIYSKDSNGFWWKAKYDSEGNQTYYETSGGYWAKCEYDSNGNLTYSEDGGCQH